MDLPYPPLQPPPPPPPTTASSSMPARRTHMEDGICPVNKKRRLALGARVEVDSSKQIRSQWVDFQFLPKERVLSTNGFIDTVNFILRKHSGLGVSDFSVKFELWKEHAHDIDGWVSFAIASKARVLVLNFSPYMGLYENNYSFPCHLFNERNGSHFKVLQLYTVTFGPTPDFCGFANLTMLTLKHVLVLDNFQYFLPKCPALEWLEILMCSQLHNLHVSEPLPRLEFLRVQGCAINKIELHAPKLTTFEYRGCFKVIIALHKCLKLKTASIVSTIEDNLEYVFTGLPNGLPHVERLCVEVFVRTQIPGFTQPPLKFTNLRHLTMSVTIGCAKRFGKNAVLQLAYLLEAAPLLVDLHLYMMCADICEDPPARDVIVHRPYYNLERACMTGFNGNGGQIALVRFILRNAVKLQKMTIVPKGRRTDKMMGEYELSLRMIREKIVPKDKNGVLVIL
uniref:At1g61320/AtMIF1 LRR domain-containing protein n=1 Tax=Oryza punctata TaxID=4537 RepID=A0A0E0KFQ1_ORYPU